MKALYSIEYRDADGFLEIKKAFLTDGELRELMDEFCSRGVKATVYRNSPGPMPELRAGPAVISGDGERSLLELPDPDDDR